MRRLFQACLLVAVGYGGPSLAGEPGAKEPAVGDLLKQLGDKDPDTVCAAATALGKHGPVKEAAPALKPLLASRHCRVKCAAANALWRLEHNATELVPVYAELLVAADADVRAAAAWRLGRLGNDAGPAVLLLAGALRDESLEVRIQAGLALANLGTSAVPALPALVRALGDPLLDERQNRDQGREAVRHSPALPAIIALADDAIPLLIETFHDRRIDRPHEDPAVTPAWQIASRAVLVFPALGGRAVPALVGAMDSEHADTREYAALALREIAELNGLPDAAIDMLEKCLGDPSSRVRVAAARGLAWARPSSPEAAAVLDKAEKAHEIGTDKLLADLEPMIPHIEHALKLMLRLLPAAKEKTARAAHRILADAELPVDRVLPVWIRALAHPDTTVRSQAIDALRKLGPSAKAAKTVLHERFPKESDYYSQAGILDALTAIDPDDPALVPLLVKSLGATESFVRWRAAENLEALGPKAKDALPRIEALLLNPGEKGKPNALDDDAARHLVDAVVSIAPRSGRTAALLLKALRLPGIRAMHDGKNSWYMRDVLEDALQANLPEAAPVLREALKDPDAEVRTSAALVLVRAGLDVETALPALMGDLWGGTGAREQSRFQWRVVRALMRRRPSVTPAVAAALCKAWPAAGHELRETLEPGLLVLQPESLPHLLDQLRRANTPQSRWDLAHLLARFDGQGKHVVPHLREELRDRRPAKQYAAATALRHLGPEAAEAIPELLQLLRSPHPGMRAVAMNGLGHIGTAARSAVPDLKAIFKEGKPAMRLVAAGALSRIDPDVSETLVVLRDALVEEKRDDLRRDDRIDLPGDLKGIGVYPDSIEESVVRFGERAVPVLAGILEDVDLDEWSADNVSAQCGSAARVRAALLLAKLGPAAKAAVPALTRALSDRDPFVREAAASALGRAGPAAREAAPDVIRLLEHQNRLASVGAWTSDPQAGGRYRGPDRDGYDGPFQFRSAGRQSILNRISFGYDRDPYAHIRPADRYDAPYVLSRSDSETRSAQPILGEMAKDPNHPGRLSAALALWRSGGDTAELIPAFVAALEANATTGRHDRIPLSPDLRECLAELGGQLKPALQPLVEWLKKRQSTADIEDQVAVVEAIGSLGADAREAAELLRPMLRGDRWGAKARVAAALALYRICGEKAPGMSVLGEVLAGEEDRPSFYSRTDWTRTARVLAARAMGVLAESGDERARALISELAKGDENRHVRDVAIESLARQKRQRK